VIHTISFAAKGDQPLSSKGAKDSESGWLALILTLIHQRKKLLTSILQFKDIGHIKALGFAVLPSADSVEESLMNLTDSLALTKG
jgi:hypothetical protein